MTRTMALSPLQHWLLSYVPQYQDDVNQQFLWRDGCLYAEVLKHIYHDGFQSLRLPLRSNSHSSWVFMKLDLERIMRSIQSYYKQHLGLVLDHDRVPHLGQLARNGRVGGEEDCDNVDKMIVLVLGCAVTCPHRKLHIDKILSWPDIKMKTEILKQVAALGMERTFVNLQKQIVPNDCCPGKYGDIVINECNHQEQDSRQEFTISFLLRAPTMSLTQSDLLTLTTTMSPSGLLETSFDTDDDEREGDDSCDDEIISQYCLPDNTRDVECQVEWIASELLATSEIIDVDQDCCFFNDASTETIFNDHQRVSELEDKIRLLVSSLESAEKRNMELLAESELLSGKSKKYENTLKLKNKEVVDFKSKFEMTLKELGNLETLFKQEKEKDGDLIRELKGLIDALQTESNELREENQEMESRLWSVIRKQNFSNNRILLVTPDAMSTASSGFFSGTDVNTDIAAPVAICQHEHQQQPVLDMKQLKLLEAETERLTDLLGVMEEREEQLVTEVKSQEEARLLAEEEVARREAADKMGERMKRVLLLTAAFGAVHTALQHDIIMGSCTML